MLIVGAFHPVRRSDAQVAPVIRAEDHRTRLLGKGTVLQVHVAINRDAAGDQVVITAAAAGTAHVEIGIVILEAGHDIPAVVLDGPVTQYVVAIDVDVAIDAHVSCPIALVAADAQDIPDRQASALVEVGPRRSRRGTDIQVTASDPYPCPDMCARPVMEGPVVHVDIFPRVHRSRDVHVARALGMSAPEVQVAGGVKGTRSLDEGAIPTRVHAQVYIGRNGGHPVADEAPALIPGAVPQLYSGACMHIPGGVHCRGAGAVGAAEIHGPQGVQGPGGLVEGPVREWVIRHLEILVDGHVDRAAVLVQERMHPATPGFIVPDNNLARDVYLAGRPADLHRPDRAIVACDTQVAAQVQDRPVAQGHGPLVAIATGSQLARVDGPPVHGQGSIARGALDPAANL